MCIISKMCLYIANVVFIIHIIITDASIFKLILNSVTEAELTLLIL